MSKLIFFIITGTLVMSVSTARADDHADDERMEDHISLKPSVTKMDRLPAQVILNAKACEGKNPSDRVEDQTSGKMVACSEAKKEMGKLESAKNVGY